MNRSGRNFSQFHMLAFAMQRKRKINNGGADNEIFREFSQRNGWDTQDVLSVMFFR